MSSDNFRFMGVPHFKEKRLDDIALGGGGGIGQRSATQTHTYITEKKIPSDTPFIVLKNDDDASIKYFDDQTPPSISPALSRIADFQSRIDKAAWYLGAACSKARTPYKPTKTWGWIPRHRKPYGSYSNLVRECLKTSNLVCDALVFDWSDRDAQPLANSAFDILAELSPSAQDLVRLREINKPKAYSDLAALIETIAREVEVSATILAGVEDQGIAKARAVKKGASGEDDLKVSLLAKAGGEMSLTEAAKRLGISRQGAYKKIKAHAMLGMMFGNDLVIPKLQFFDVKAKTDLVDGLRPVLALFKVAGPWSALQFLVEPDPNFGYLPIDALRQGKGDQVKHAARVYLGMVEG